MPVRMKDVARDLGVSIITVSKALRNHTDISAATRARVIKKAKELNYRPNLAARALVTGRTYMMGLVVPDLVRPFFAFLARGLSNELRGGGYTLLISSSEDDAELEKQAIDQLVARRVDALLVASIQWNVETFRRIEEAGIPYILIDRGFLGLDANFVGVNDEEVGTIATEHLIEIGCKTIAHISRTRISSAVGRLEGYKKTMARHGFALGSDYIFHTDRTDAPAEVMGYDAARMLLELNPRPDGIF
jgi:LacI family transcriptional regulator, galactose operon repressor